MVHLHGSKCQTVFNKEMFIHQEESEEIIKGSKYSLKQRQKYTTSIYASKNKSHMNHYRIIDGEEDKLLAFGVGDTGC